MIYAQIQIHWPPCVTASIPWASLGVFANQLYNSTVYCQRNYQRSSSLALCEGNPAVTDGFPSQRSSDVQNFFMSWRHRALQYFHICWNIEGTWRHYNVKTTSRCRFGVIITSSLRRLSGGMDFKMTTNLGDEKYCPCNMDRIFQF